MGWRQYRQRLVGAWSDGLYRHAVYAGPRCDHRLQPGIGDRVVFSPHQGQRFGAGTIEVPSYFRVDPSYTRDLGNAGVPWGRVGLPQDVGYLASYLLSDASEFMTGSVLTFDGGLTAKMALPYDPPMGER